LQNRLNLLKVKKASITLICSLFTVLIGFSQTKEIYIHPKFQEIAANHKKIAIIPFKASVILRPNQMKNLTPNQLENLEKEEGMAVQSTLIEYFLGKKERKEMEIQILDLQTTNAILEQNGIDYSTIDHYTPVEICGILGVDAVISGTISLYQLMTNAGSVANSVLLNKTGPTHSGRCVIFINDGESGTLLWNYDNTLSRDLGSNINTIITKIMRKASQKLPYLKK
jgi:hypothetical protein